MPPAEINPRLPVSVRAFALVVVAVLCVGLLLFLHPELVRARWPWLLPPFNARFLGAFYAAELVPMAWLAWRNRWSPARLILITAACFTILVTLVCLLHLDSFDFTRKAPWLWFVLYAVSGLVSLYFLWRHWHLPHPGRSLSQGWRTFFLVQAALLAAYGLALLLAPEQAASFWPWPIDAFHGQVYSAIFLTLALGCLVLAWRASREELLVFAATEMALGAAVLASLPLADRTLGKVNWMAGGTWAWFGLFLAIAGAGALLAALAPKDRAR